MPLRSPTTRGRAAAPGLAVAAVLAVLVPACMVQPPARTRNVAAARDAEPAPRRGGTLVVAQERPTTLDPLPSTDVYSTTISNQLFVGLLRFGANLDPTPALAQTWTISPDGLTYDFRLQPNVRYHNGRLLTSDDVAYSLRRAFEPGGTGNIASLYLAAIDGAEEYQSGRANTVRGLQARGADQLTIRLRRPDPSFLWALCLPQAAVVPREEVERAGPAHFARHPVGCGPFRFVSWDDSHVVVARNPDYFGAKPYVDTLVFVTPASLATEYGSHELLAGRVDVTDVNQAHYPAIAASPRLHVMRRRQLALGFLGLNCRIPPLDHPKVREAVAYAINREALIRVDTLGAVLANGVLPPGVQCYSPVPKALPYDPERAASALEAAGYASGKGLPPLDYWVPVRSGVRRTADSLLVEDLRRVGFRVRVHEVEWRDLSQRIATRRAALFSLAWIADIPDPDSFLGSLFDSRSTSNMFQFQDPRVDTLLMMARESRDPMQRARLFQQAEAEVLVQVAVVPLNHSATLYGTSGRVHGFELTPLGISVFDFSRVWLHESPPAL